MSKKKKHSLLRSGYTVSGMTIISRVVGLVREIVCANIFGASASFDAFLVAFRIPNFMRRLFAEGAFSQAFVPVLSEYRQNRSESDARLFIDRMAGTLALVLFIVTVIAVIVAPILVMVFAPGFLHDPTRFSLASGMLRITFPYLLFISLTAFGGAILNSYDIFSVPAFTPVLLNITLIFAAVVMAPHFHHPITALAWGVFLGGIIQLCFQLPFLWRIHRLPRPKVCWRDEGVRRVIKLMVPAILGVSVVQIGILLDTLFASFLREGSITWLYFSDRLTNFPLGVFGIAIATVVLPHLSRKHANKSPEEFSAALDWALRWILLVGIPAGIGLFFLSGPILSTLLEHGKFTAFDVIMTRKSVMAFAVGIPAFMLIKVLATGFYSMQNIKTPVKIAIIAVSSNVILNIILIYPLAHAGLALSTSLAACLNSSLLFYNLRRRNIFQPKKGWIKFFIRLLIANIAMGTFLWFTSTKLSIWFQYGWKQRVIHLMPLLLGAAIVYFMVLAICGIRWRDFKSTHLTD